MMKITIIITITISIIIRLSSKLLHHCYYDNPPHCHHHHHHHQTSLKEGCRGLSASYSRAPANWLWIRRLSSSNLELLRSTANKIIIIIRVELSTKLCWHFVFAITTVWGRPAMWFSDFLPDVQLFLPHDIFIIILRQPFQQMSHLLMIWVHGHHHCPCSPFPTCWCCFLFIIIDHVQFFQLFLLVDVVSYCQTWRTWCAQLWSCDSLFLKQGKIHLDIVDDRVAGLGRLSAGAKMAMKPFV